MLSNRSCIFFITQNPKDVPPDIPRQLGNRIQHALRAFTPDDETSLKAAARTFPKTDFYDIEETLTTLGIGEALVTVLGSTGIPTPPFATRMIPPGAKEPPSTFEQILKSPMTRTVAREVTRGLLGALLGTHSRRRRGSLF